MSTAAEDFVESPCCEAVVKESTRLTPSSGDEVRQIVLKINQPMFRFEEGQSIGVMVPGPHEFGNKYHTRRYSIAESRIGGRGECVELTILVRRCFYLDEVNGEQYPGIASNYLCDAEIGERLQLSGPYRTAFGIPKDSSTNILMIGTGTGIAPFRAFVKQIYHERGEWKGQVRLFYGARNGMESIYMNDHSNDISNYYDEETFKAFNAVSSRLLSDDGQALERTIEDHLDEAWNLLQDENTHVFLAGLKKTTAATDKVMSKKAGSEAAWSEFKQKLVTEGRWSELLYS
ncbi:MAG: oxidoreductase [Candidatus Sedimenticola sp. PURPLELP]